MAEIKISDRYPFLPKWAERKSIDTITIRDNKVIVRERSLRKHGRLFVHGYDPLQHAVSDVWGR